MTPAAWIVAASASLAAAAPVEARTPFEAFLDAYSRSAPEERAALVQSFIELRRERGGFPLIEPGGTVVFFYSGTGGERSVRLVGDFRPRDFRNVYWDERGEAMTRAAPDGAVFYKRLRFETDARLDYAFRVDGEHRLDPLNPAVVKSGMTGEANEVVMPGYRRSTPLVARAETTRGTLRVVNQEWAKSRVVVYLPAGYDPSREHPVVYTTDGGAWIDYVDLPAILDHLIAEGVIEPLIAVMIDPLEDRGPWYDFDSGYPAYLETVVAHVDGAFSTRTGAADRLHIGTSAGGRATLSVWLERPDLFRNLAMLSPALAGRRRSIESRFHGSGRDHGNLRVWLSAGTYEGAIHRETRVLERRLRSAGASTKAVYTHEGHSFGAWRNLTGAMLEYFFPLRPESPPAAPPRP